ncbi:OmpA family protein [Bizionia arctica]|uniref:Cell envelope biogenesis protein OmpA n=1 Tax=Bizionia arctica TaxID=1495645 RepID=A0A917GKV3_9FLAO|nr:OmpA family protein [Bizionia arctica]GGG49906.1 cell envelope biogenesis protein OmpA [Bizionia arctica]
MKTKVILTIIALSSTFLFSQEKVADKFFDNYAYLKAAELYQDAVDKGKENEHVLTRLGDCYYNNSDSEQAAIWYGKALAKYSDVSAEHIYKYIQTQRSLKNYEEADKWLEKFKEKQDGDSRGKKVKENNLYLYEKLASTAGTSVKLENLLMNSGYSDFGSFVNANTIYFASARDIQNDIYKWNDEPFLDLYQGTISTTDGKKEISDVKKLSFEGVQKKNLHTADAIVTNDGNTMYFSRMNVGKRNRARMDKEGTVQLKIYKATLIDSTWSNIEELPINNDAFSTYHPALSPDNKTLYFTSDREGGLGQTDIYKVELTGDNTYGAVSNLGPKINTEGRESFPFVAKDSTLYFSSDGFLNLGLLDVFKSDYIKNEDAEAVNLGAPYNSGYDDFAFFIDSDSNEGYFSSNRLGGKGSDDIYGFTVIECTQKVEGIARNSKTLEPLPMTTVQLIDEFGKIVREITTNELGEYAFDLDCNSTYKILGSKPDYKDALVALETTDEFEKVHKADLLLIPLINDNEIVINPIFFNFDKWDIRPDAAYELENIVSVMREHPNMVIKIESYTDSRGTDSYNMKLSDRRAKSTRDYLYSRNIAQERIASAIGYGETDLVNDCSSGVECTEAQHQANRRSKFIILNDNEN